LNGENEPKRDKFKTDAQYNVALNHYRTSITGLNSNQFKVFSVVLNLTCSYVNKYSPNYIVFVANEENRQRLYEKCMDKVLTHLIYPYKRITVDPEMGYELEAENFWYEKQE